MFANLKNKLIEEVKASPSKFQQAFSQAQAAVTSSTTTTPSGSESSATTTTNENFFSITEEDTPQNTPLRLPLGNFRNRSTTPQALNNGAGATSMPRTRKLSNSSMASDVSFRLPAYDAPATYHLQSDLESEFGSEMGDEGPTHSKLDVITKEKLFEAYKKSLDRYNKYRCRYTDLVKQYKDLERDSSKARAVLIETQDKALRRINELREQCTLEQGAKAHLEQALRVEMDDMKCKLQAYETKLKLLGENPENIKPKSLENDNESLIELENDEVKETMTVNGAASTIKNDELIQLEDEAGTNDSESISKINALTAQLKLRDGEIAELLQKLSTSTAEIEKLKKQEEENVLLLAETKHAIHTELESKERAVRNLNEALRESKNELQTQANGQLSELKELREKLKQTLTAKQEVDAKLIAVEHMYSTLKEQHATQQKSQQAHEEKTTTLTKESEQQLQSLRQQNVQLQEMLQRYQHNEVSLAEVDNELNRTKNENDKINTLLAESERKLAAALQELEEARGGLAQKGIEQQASAENLDAERQLNAELRTQLEAERVQSVEIERQNEKLAEEVRLLMAGNAQSEHEAIVLLKEELQQAQAAHAAQIDALKEQLSGREKELKSSGNKMAKHKKQHESQQNKIKEQTDELEKLRDELNKHAEHLQALHVEAREREEHTEVEKNQLKTQISNIVLEIGQMEEQMREVQRSHAELEAEKRQLELHIERMRREDEVAEVERVVELERKLQNVESENSQLAERNCLLAENVNRLEKLHAEHERQQTSEAALEGELRAKLETAENAIQKLNEKMTQVLDENSRMQNAQELMDHDYRSLQDKYDALEKEKLMVEDAQSCTSAEMLQLQSERNEETTNLQENIKALEAQVAQLSKETEALRVEKMQMEATKAERDSELVALRCQLDDVDAKMQDYEQLKAEVELLRAQRDQLQQEATTLSEQLAQKSELTNEMELKQAELRTAMEQQTQLLNEKSNELEKLRELMSRNAKERTEEHESLKLELTELIELEHRAVEQLEASKAEQTRLIAELENRLQSANNDIEQLHENNVAYQVEIEQLRSKHDLEVQELTATMRRLQDEHSLLQEQIKSTNEKAVQLNEYEQLKLENEYLNKPVQLLESQVKQQNEDANVKSQEGDELKEKLKSLQCELYVLKENVEKHGAELHEKQQELAQTQQEKRNLEASMAEERLELARQSEHANYVTQQNDIVQKDLLHTQQLLADVEQKLQKANLELEQSKDTANEQVLSLEQQLNTLRTESERSILTIETLNKEVSELTAALQAKEQLTAAHEEELHTIDLTANETMPTIVTNTTRLTSTNDAEHLRELNATLQRELEDLKHRSSTEITNLQHEIEDLQSNAKQSNERIMELERIRAGLQAQKLFSTDVRSGGMLAVEMQHEVDHSDLQREKAELEAKLKQIINDVQDVSNRNLFLEQKCENYLILEQSNERLKLQNAKLSRQLDETLVSMQHNEGVNANTEFEYLKNIMFQYLTGSSNGNNETLVKVISAVLKFSPQETQVALEKEHQRRSLINKIL